MSESKIWAGARQGLEWGSGPYLLKPSVSHREQFLLIPIVDLPSITLAVRRPREAGLSGRGPAAGMVSVEARQRAALSDTRRRRGDGR
jgi:hypothetical protein